MIKPIEHISRIYWRNEMKPIWLVRHGQSKSQTGEDNDTVNPELSSRGEQQAKRLVEPLKGIFLMLF